MDTTVVLAIIGAIVVLAVIGLLLWKFDVVKFGSKIPGGIEFSGEGSRHAPASAPGKSHPSGTARASGAGGVAIGGGAEKAEIKTNVTAPFPDTPAPAPSGAAVEAAGAGSIAIGGDAKEAKIASKVGGSGGGAA